MKVGDLVRHKKDSPDEVGVIVSIDETSRSGQWAEVLWNVDIPESVKRFIAGRKLYYEFEDLEVINEC